MSMRSIAVTLLWASAMGMLAWSQLMPLPAVLCLGMTTGAVIGWGMAKLEI